MLKLLLSHSLDFDTLCAHFSEVQCTLLCESVIGLNTEAQFLERDSILTCVIQALSEEAYCAALLIQEKHALAPVLVWLVRYQIATQLVEKFGIASGTSLPDINLSTFERSICSCSAK